MVLNTDPVIVLSLAFFLGAIAGATLVQILILPRVKAAETDNERLRSRKRSD